MSCSDITWTTRDGEELRLHKMEDSHLLNTYQFMCRIETAYRHVSFQGEMAEYYYEHDIAGVEAWVELLSVEIHRRGLQEKLLSPTGRLNPHEPELQNMSYL